MEAEKGTFFDLFRSCYFRCRRQSEVTGAEEGRKSALHLDVYKVVLTLLMRSVLSADKVLRVCAYYPHSLPSLSTALTRRIVIPSI